jgi:hypothetical protein
MLKQRHYQGVYFHYFGGKLLQDVLNGLPAYLNPHGRMYLMSRSEISVYLPANGLITKNR